MKWGCKIRHTSMTGSGYRCLARPKQCIMREWYNDIRFVVVAEGWSRNIIDLSRVGKKWPTCYGGPLLFRSWEGNCVLLSLGNDVLFGRLYKSLMIPLVQRGIKSSAGKFPGPRHADNSRSRISKIWGRCRVSTYERQGRQRRGSSILGWVAWIKKALLWQVE